MDTSQHHMHWELDFASLRTTSRFIRQVVARDDLESMLSTIKVRSFAKNQYWIVIGHPGETQPSITSVSAIRVSVYRHRSNDRAGQLKVPARKRRLVRDHLRESRRTHIPPTPPPPLPHNSCEETAEILVTSGRPCWQRLKLRRFRIERLYKRLPGQRRACGAAYSNAASNHPWGAGGVVALKKCQRST